MIITQTVGQMTDGKALTTIGTQTPLPQTCLSFSSLTGNAITHQQKQQQQQQHQKSNSKYSPFEQKMLENELLLQTQRNALKNIDRILNDEQFINKTINRKNVEISNDVPAKSFKSLEQPANFIHRHMNIDQTAIRMVIYCG